MRTAPYRGIDYGLGQSNIDHKTGIRYGVISQNAVLQAWADSCEGFYGEPICPDCGNTCKTIDDPTLPDTDLGDDENGNPIEPVWERAAGECEEYACEDCHKIFGGESAFGDEPLSYVLDDGTYLAESDSSGDIFITKSPYYTCAQFCSPCAPGACYLTEPCEDGERAYCFDAEWFDNEDPCPYPIWKVSDDSLVYSPEEQA